MSDSIPKSGEFQNGKLWFHRRGAILTVGLTSSAVDQLGEISGVELPDEGEDCGMGEVVVTVEGSHGSIEVTTPAGGTIQEVNAAAQDEPDMVTEDPLEEGWLIKIELENPEELLELAQDGAA